MKSHAIGGCDHSTDISLQIRKPAFGRNLSDENHRMDKEDLYIPYQDIYQELSSFLTTTIRRFSIHVIQSL